MRDMTEHLRRVQIKYLAREYETIERYNEDAEEVVEPYRFLCIADFPSKFDTEAVTRLLSIAEKGVPTGVYLLAHINADVAMPRDFTLDALLRSRTRRHPHLRYLPRPLPIFPISPRGMELATESLSCQRQRGQNHCSWRPCRITARTGNRTRIT